MREAREHFKHLSLWVLGRHSGEDTGPTYTQPTAPQRYSTAHRTHPSDTPGQLCPVLHLGLLSTSSVSALSSEALGCKPGPVTNQGLTLPTVQNEGTFPQLLERQIGITSYFEAIIILENR